MDGNAPSAVVTTQAMAPAIPSSPPPASSPGVPRRPFLIRVGKKLRRRVDGIVARSSKVPNDPVLDPALFPWTAALRQNWRAIRDEALAVAGNPDHAPALNCISPDHRRIAPSDSWRCFFLVAYGTRIERNIAHCPQTTAVLDQVPGLNSGFFSILKPGTHIPQHRGVTKGLMTCHLGLQVPQGPLRMEVGGETLGWAEGEALLFDDTWPHEVWNDTDSVRIVLLVQFERPLRQPGRLVAGSFLGGIRRSAFVKEATHNIARWQESLKRIEQAAN
ncbi:MAG TPA: aspartyl/asparaginyl beta-hydroxylase domain-containing protein [Sphingomonas sp.]|nr:aspartyl/asparaginyl beta-hydroxylase domain-containing protein [Sphingomonas sp.]